MCVIIIHVSGLDEFRRNTILLSGDSLKDELDQLKGPKDKITRDFLGSGGRQSMTFYMERGHILMKLRTEFYRLWSTKVGREVPIPRY